ncbi:hypothetical protein RCOM_0251410 [Ricinus communis]|uniref:Retrotransposon gag domain-containing protein n=1 Tax=Ricinus communis TaxID=3988 RepID=B9SUW3_RICCO|nr:hypothetical protein RCOM_0251410 [Ricinus communis]
MVVSDNTRSQEFKKMEESIKSIVRGMLSENNKVLLDSVTKQDQAITDLSKKHNQSMTLMMNEIRALTNSRQPSNNILSPSNSSYGFPNHASTADYMQQGTGNTNYHLASRFTKVEFPRFGGEDVEGWLFKYDRFFQIDQTPSNSQVKLALIHLEGRALQWHQTFIKNRGELGEPPWNDYVRAIKCRFRVRTYKDPMADLKMLVQIGSVSDYLEEFDVLSHKNYRKNTNGSKYNNLKPFNPRTRRLTDEEISEKEQKIFVSGAMRSCSGAPMQKKQLHMVIVQDFPKEDGETTEEM